MIIKVELDIGRCANEDADPKEDEPETMYQRGHWALKGVDCEIPHRLKKGTSTSTDTESLRGVDYEIPYHLERGSSRGKIQR